MAYLELSWILRSRLLVCFTLSIPSVYLILASPCVCIILTLWVSDSQHAHVVPFWLLVSVTKYSLNLLLSITLLNIRFDWDDSHDQVSKFLKENAMIRLGHKSSYHIICGAPLYIKFLLTGTVSDEKETNVDVLDALATWWPPIIPQENGTLVVLVKMFSMTWCPWSSIKYLVHHTYGMQLWTPTISDSVELQVFSFCLV